MERKTFQEHTLVKIGGRNVGLLGLAEALERVRRAAPAGRAEAERLLLEEVGRRNYIAPSAVAEYGEALWREYLRSTGQPVPEEGQGGGGARVSVLGASCAACERLEQDIIAVLAEEGVAAEVEHVRDPAEIARRGVLSTPALMIGGRLIPGGAAASRAQLRELVRKLGG